MNNSINKKEYNEDFDYELGIEDADEDFDLGEAEELEGFGEADLYDAGLGGQSTYVSMEKIRELKMTTDNKDFLKILDEAESLEIQAERSERFSHSLSQREKARELHEKATEAYEKVSDKIEEESDQEEGEKDFKHKDSAPRKTDSKTQTAFYDVDLNISLHANYDDAVDKNEITASKVTLAGATLNDSFVVTFDESQKCFVVVAEGTDKNGKKRQETFRIADEQLERIIFASNKVDYSGLSEEQFKKIQVGADAQTAKKNANVQWPKEGLVGLIPDSDHAGEARRLAQKIDAAVLGTGSWDEIGPFLNNWYYDSPGAIGGDNATGYNAALSKHEDEYMNDIVRKVFTAIYRASGATSEKDPRLQKLIEKIPTDIRRMLMERVTKDRGELGEVQAGEKWTSRETADVIEESINKENEIGDPDEPKPELETKEAEEKAK